MKITGGRVCDWVGRPRQVIVPWHIAVEPLMDAEQAEEVRWDLIGGRASAALPKQRVEIVRLAQQGALARVEALRNRFKIQQPARELEV